MANDARVNIVGNLVNEPKTSQWNNSSILSFGVSVRTTKKKEGTQYYESDIYNVTVWGKQGELLLNSLQKGTMVWVEGDMMMRSYKNRNNETVTSPSVNASSVKVLAKGKPGAYQSKDTESHSQQAEDEEPPF